MSSAYDYDPLKYYNTYLKDKVSQTAQKYFDEKNKKANTDASANSISYDKYLKHKKSVANLKDKSGRYKGLRAFLIFLIVISLIVAFICGFILTSGTDSMVLCIALLVAGLVLSIALIIVICVVINKKIKNINLSIAKHSTIVNQCADECMSQLAPLKYELTDDDFRKIVNESTDVFKLEDNLSVEKYSMLVELYDYKDVVNENESVLSVLSGSVDTNPFVKLRAMSLEMYKKVYTGSITISWTEVVGSGKDRRVVTRTQVLTASVEKDAPLFGVSACLVYANNAAPDLCFTRRPSGLDKSDDEKDVERLIKKKSKKTLRRSDKSIVKGGSFQAMGNLDFESLFETPNRNQEVQYRLLFTPLAQQNMIKLITSKAPYGDDFIFCKREKLNIITSKHAQRDAGYKVSAYTYELSFDKLKQNFLNQVLQCFTSLYFDLAPVLAIPLYVQTECGEYQPKYKLRKITNYEAEQVANAMDRTLFAHPETNTEQLLKVEYLNTIGESDTFIVHSSSFKGVERVDMVPRMGGDGRMHMIPVKWIEYIPVRKDSYIAIRNTDLTDRQGADLLHEKEYFASEKEKYQNIVSGNKMLGIFLPDGYNYTQEEDQVISADLQRLPRR